VHQANGINTPLDPFTHEGAAPDLITHEEAQPPDAPIQNADSEQSPVTAIETNTPNALSSVDVDTLGLGTEASTDNGRLRRSSRQPKPTVRFQEWREENISAYAVEFETIDPSMYTRDKALQRYEDNHHRNERKQQS